MICDYEFFLVCAPGFEDVCEAELRAWFPALAARRERGGLMVTAPLATGFAFNRVLKTPTRVLLRLMTFGCRDFPKLHRKISGFAWEEWLDDRGRVTFHASSGSSRLKIKTRIEETCWDAKVHRLRKRGRPHARFEGPPADVYIRIESDVCTLSLDTSGEILHKRGVRALTSEAPVRETTAAALLLAMRMSALEAGLPVEGIELIDAMCGSGTFLLEANGLFREIRSRRFAYEDCKCSTAVEAPASPAGSFSRLIGYDRDEAALAVARANLSNAMALGEFELRAGDFFEAQASSSEAHRWVVANPPYDERLAVAGGLHGFYERLLASAERAARPEVAGFLFPESARPETLRLPAGWVSTAARRFSNGGIAVIAMVYLRRR